MKFEPDLRRLAQCTVIAASAAFASLAQADTLADAQARYQRERAACLSGQTHHDRATCLKEAGAALDEARRGRLQDYGHYLQNALARCQRLPAEERKDCEARMQGRGEVYGSVEGGGLYRELVTRQVMQPDGTWVDVED